MQLVADFSKKTYYFKLTGKRSYFFKVEEFTFTTQDSIIYIWNYNAKLGFPTTKENLEKFLSRYMLDKGMKYEEITNQQEIEAIKLLYEDKI